MRAFKYSNKISVVYNNGMADEISPLMLDSLIKTRKVDQFERSEGWAEVGIDPVRGMGGDNYDGGDRRLN